MIRKGGTALLRGPAFRKFRKYSQTIAILSVAGLLPAEDDQHARRNGERRYGDRRNDNGERRPYNGERRSYNNDRNNDRKEGGNR